MPIRQGSYVDAMLQLKQLKEEGLVQHLGITNFR